jgi:hypothetical protein
VERGAWQRGRQIVVVATPSKAFRDQTLPRELALRPNERERIFECEAAIGRAERLRVEAERRSGLNSERARIAEKQSGEIRAEVPEKRLGVARRPGPRVEDAAVREDHLEAENAVGEMPSAHSRGSLGETTADGCVQPRERAEKGRAHPRAARPLAKIRPSHAGLDGDVTVRHRQLDQAVHPPQVDHHRPRLSRDGRERVGHSAATRHERHSGRVCDARDGRHLVGARGLDHDLGDGEPLLGKIESAPLERPTVDANSFGAEQRFELPRRVRVVCADGRGRDGHAVAI